MNRRISTVSISGEYEETITRLAKHLGRDKLRRTVFNCVYGRGTKPRSKRQIMHGLRLSESASQQVQNALDHLSKHNLITKTENDGSVGNGCRNLYSKDEVVRANRAAIVKFADDAKAADKVPTARRPVLQIPESLASVSQRDLKARKHLDVLYLTANPDQLKPLRVDVEVRKVKEKIRSSKFRDSVSVDYMPAADLDSLIDGLNDNRPQVVHFSSHGNSNGIATDNAKTTGIAAEFLSFRMLAKAFAATDEPPKVVVLNACKSSGARKFLLPAGKTKRVLVAMRNSIGDAAAVAFAKNFYAALAAGQSVKSAFEQGKVAVEAESIGEASTPELLSNGRVNPARMFLV